MAVQQRVRGAVTVAGVAAAVAMALAGCGSGADGRFTSTSGSDTTAGPSATPDSGDTSDLRSAPIPATSPKYDESAMPAKPPREAAPARKIEWELLDSTSRTAGAVDPAAKGTCPTFDPTKNSTVTCTVAYRGVTVTYTVNITGGSYLFTYRYQADPVAVTRDHVENSLRFFYRAEKVACDMDEVALVPAGRTSDVECRAEVFGKVQRYYVTAGRYSVSFDRK